MNRLDLVALRQHQPAQPQRDPRLRLGRRYVHYRWRVRQFIPVFCREHVFGPNDLFSILPFPGHKAKKASDGVSNDNESTKNVMRFLRNLVAHRLYQRPDPLFEQTKGFDFL